MNPSSVMLRKIIARVNRHFIPILATVIIGIPLAYKIPIGPDSYAYRSVAGNDRVVTGTQSSFYLRRGQLYLPVQWSNHSLLAPLTQAEEWSEVRLRKLVTANPGLSHLLPDPGSPDGGVRWIHE